MFEELTQQAKTAVLEIIEQAKIGKGSIFVVGCSSSTVKGENYGKASSMEIAQAIFDGIYPELKSRGIFLAAQCCEHLNRAIITEREAAEKLREPEVNVVPQPKAGGSFATITYNTLENPVAVEHIKADAGIDIGGVLIGIARIPFFSKFSLNQFSQYTFHHSLSFSKIKAAFLSYSIQPYLVSLFPQKRITVNFPC